MQQTQYPQVNNPIPLTNSQRQLRDELQTQHDKIVKDFETRARSAKRSIYEDAEDAFKRFSGDLHYMFDKISNLARTGNDRYAATLIDSAVSEQAKSRLRLALDQDALNRVIEAVARKDFEGAIAVVPEYTLPMERGLMRDVLLPHLLSESVTALQVADLRKLEGLIKLAGGDFDKRNMRRALNVFVFEKAAAHANLGSMHFVQATLKQASDPQMSDEMKFVLEEQPEFSLGAQRRFGQLLGASPNRTQRKSIITAGPQAIAALELVMDEAPDVAQAIDSATEFTTQWHLSRFPKILVSALASAREAATAVPEALSLSRGLTQE